VALTALVPGTVLFDGERMGVTATDARSGVAAEITRDGPTIRSCVIRGLRIALLDELVLNTGRPGRKLTHAQVRTVPLL
jgi:hypothetical protein